MNAVVFAMPGNGDFARDIAAMTDAELGRLEYRKFPDRESYLRFTTNVRSRQVVLACSLHDPDSKAVPLLLAAAALRDLGATRVGLAAPYLAYMRQDRRFKEGEAVTSTGFARLLSASFDWIATIDPHLHRHVAMSEIYTIPAFVGHAAPVLVDYVRQHTAGAFLVGPDEESEQWVAAVAAAAGVPHVTLRKERRGDRDVVINFPDLAAFAGKTPVLVDDVISSGRTMEVAVRQLRKSAFDRPVCLAAHGIFAGDAHARLVAAGAVVVVTNTIPGPAALLDIHPLFAELIKPQLLERT
jgi:ribose-phosphate pyrophosphokinase